MAERRCSFCGKGQDQVKKLIGGPKDVAICDDCVAFLKKIIDEEFSEMPRREPAARRNSWLDRFRRMAAISWSWFGCPPSRIEYGVIVSDMRTVPPFASGHSCANWFGPALIVMVPGLPGSAGIPPTRNSAGGSVTGPLIP